MQQLIAFVLIRHDTGGTGVFLRHLSPSGACDAVATHAQRLLVAGQRDDGHHRDRAGGGGDPRRGPCGRARDRSIDVRPGTEPDGTGCGSRRDRARHARAVRRISADATKGAGGVQRGERLVRTHGLQGAHLRRGLEGRLGAAEPHASRRPDLVEGDFRVRTANRLWAADLTQIMTVRACCGWPASGCADPRAGAARQRRQRRQRGLASMPVARVRPFSPNTSSDSAS